MDFDMESSWAHMPFEGGWNVAGWNVAEFTDVERTHGGLQWEPQWHLNGGAGEDHVDRPAGDRADAAFRGQHQLWLRQQPRSDEQRPDEIPAAELPEIKSVGTARGPKTKGIDRLAAISDYRTIVGNADQAKGSARNGMQLAAAKFKRAVEFYLDGFIMADDFPRTRPGQPVIGLLDLPAVLDSLAEHAVLVSQPITERYEQRYRHKDGSTVWMYVSATSVRDAEHRFIGSFAMLMDITERKRAEEEVRNTAAQWQATFDAVQDLVLLLDKDFRILRANRAAMEFLGLPFDKILGGHCFNLIHGTSLPPSECPLAKMRQSRKHEEVEVLAREGGPWLSVSVAPVFDPIGELTQVVHVARNITDRKRSEDALRRSEACLAEGQRLSHTGSWAWSPVTFEPLYWSEEMSRIFGLNPLEGVPTVETIWQRIHPEDRDRVRELQMKVAQRSLDYEHGHRIVLPDGTVKHIHAIGHPVHDEAGKLVEYVGTAMDVTERKRAEDALRRSEAYLAEGQRLTHMGGWAWSPGTAERNYWSEEMYRIFGFEPKEAPLRWNVSCNESIRKITTGPPRTGRNYSARRLTLWRITGPCGRTER